MEVDVLFNERADEEEAVVVTFFNVDWDVVTILSDRFCEGRSNKSFIELITSSIGNEAWWKSDVFATSIKEFGAIVWFSSINAS